jgi:hypothetical protein
LSDTEIPIAAPIPKAAASTPAIAAKKPIASGAKETQQAAVAEIVPIVEKKKRKVKATKPTPKAHEGKFPCPF